MSSRNDVGFVFSLNFQHLNLKNKGQELDVVSVLPYVQAYCYNKNWMLQVFCLMCRHTVITDKNVYEYFQIIFHA